MNAFKAVLFDGTARIDVVTCRPPHITHGQFQRFQARRRNGTDGFILRKVRILMQNPLGRQILPGPFIDSFIIQMNAQFLRFRIILDIPVVIVTGMGDDFKNCDG